MTLAPPPLFGTPPVMPIPPSSPAPAEPSRSSPLAQEVERAFEAVEHHGSEPAGDGRLEQAAAAKEEVQRLFREIAAEHARHLRDFAFELSTGDPRRQWADLCMPSLAMLRRTAEEMQQESLRDALADLEALVEEARASARARISGPLRQRLQASYETLAQALPEAFGPAIEDTRRESIIVEAILRLVPGIHRIAIDKLYRAGIDSLSRLRAANAVDLARAAGLDVGLCDAIVERVRHYDEERADVDLDENRTYETKRLRALVGQLRACQEDFEEAEREEDIARKRQLRKQRQGVVHEIDLVLAHLGELELIHALERAPVARKIEQLETHLRPAKRRSPPTTGTRAAAPSH